MISNNNFSARVIPFVVGVVFDADEVTGTAAPNTNMQDETPGGMISNAKLTQFSFHNPPSPNLDKLVKFMFFC